MVFPLLAAVVVVLTARPQANIPAVPARPQVDLHFIEGRKGGGQIKLSAAGLEMSSPVIGLLILAISLGFFYLYLSQVYPITEVKP
jgi:hypothetical protein